MFTVLIDNLTLCACIYQELNPAEHEIIITNKQRELYDLDTLAPDNNDLKKILLYTSIFIPNKLRSWITMDCTNKNTNVSYNQR